MLKLVGTDGGRFYSWVLKPGRYELGRLPERDLYIPHKTVSRSHALIEVDDSGETTFVTDEGSHNGTFVNGHRITQRTPLNAGDAIMFGQTEFKLSLEDDQKMPSVTLPRTVLADDSHQKSVFLSINEALKPLPKKVSEQPELLPAFFEMAKMLVLTEPKEMLLERSLTMISRVIPSERLAVLFVSEDGSEVTIAASHHTGKRDPGELKLSRTIVNEIMTNKNATIISDPKEDPRFAEQKSIIMSELKSAIAVPLFDEGKVLGILYADTSNPMHQYGDEHLRVMATFGNILASRLLNYELLNEREEKRVIDSEIKRASSIQKALLATSVPQIPGYSVHAFQEPSRSVGGDLYDVRQLPDGRLLILVADVSGKGMGAALLMSNILASFRILYDTETFDICKAVERVSIQLNKYSAPADFATLFMATIEPSTGKLCYVNAGHNPPLIARHDGRKEFLQPCGIMIGAFDFASWEPRTVQFDEDDLLLVFSDGVTEADRGDEQYGEKRMEDLVMKTRDKSPREVTAALMEDINNFIGDAPRSDDITLLLLKRERS